MNQTVLILTFDQFEERKRKLNILSILKSKIKIVSTKGDCTEFCRLSIFRKTDKTDKAQNVPRGVVVYCNKFDRSSI